MEHADIERIAADVVCAHLTEEIEYGAVYERDDCYDIPESDLKAIHRRAGELLRMVADQFTAPAPEPDHLSADALLEDGATITLEYWPGEAGQMSENGDVIEPPHDGWFLAVAKNSEDGEDTEIGHGAGDSAADALRRLRQPRPAPTLGRFDDDPPF
ncbi:hypothetical protein [Nocardia sp. NPDC005745]|uniref:hypothetical protein n=1 Tax=Nocardia sp. NPDC005745 TaxID=3157061 RepID=UPI0033D67EBB